MALHYPSAKQNPAKYCLDLTNPGTHLTTNQWINSYLIQLNLFATYNCLDHLQSWNKAQICYTYPGPEFLYWILADNLHKLFIGITTHSRYSLVLIYAEGIHPRWFLACNAYVVVQGNFLDKPLQFLLDLHNLWERSWAPIAPLLSSCYLVGVYRPALWLVALAHLYHVNLAQGGFGSFHHWYFMFSVITCHVAPNMWFAFIQ